MVFTPEGFFEVAIESWSEWHLNPRPLNSYPISQICTATPISLLFQCQISFRLLPSSFATFISIEIFWR